MRRFGLALATTLMLLGSAFPAFAAATNTAADIASMKAQAARGNASAMYNLAIAYDEGDGVPTNDTLARQWYTKAAAKGHAKAMYNLAIMYDEGEGTPEDNAKAILWYTKAANAGSYKAAYNLAIMFKTGEGTDKDLEAAAYWYGVAALSKDADSVKGYTKGLSALSNPQAAAVRARVAAFSAGHPGYGRN